MASHVAASAFGHCLALVRDDEAATRLAVSAVRRGGPLLGNVLGHARHHALLVAAAHPPPSPVLGAGAGPADVAWALARTRPLAELALVDLAGRHGLSRGGLALALRTTPAAAAGRVGAAGRAWDEELDPALLAWTGPGGCDGLAAVLAGRPTDTVAALLAAAPDVAAHAGGCDRCADRRRAMASVRRLVAGTPLPIPPPEVEEAAAASRRPAGPARVGEGAGPSTGRRQRAAGERRGRARAGGAAATAVVVLAVALGVRAVAGDRHDEAAVGTLTRVPAGPGALQFDPAALEPGAPNVTLHNSSDAAVDWEASADTPWLAVSPPEGRLAPGASALLALQGAAPEGEVRAQVRATGDDGSTAVATVAGVMERPPGLDATATGCRVTADVEDESEVALTLHWREGTAEGTAERTAPMTPVGTKAWADLPAAGPLTWWVTAMDGRGNQARTPDVAQASACQAP